MHGSTSGVSRYAVHHTVPKAEVAIRDGLADGFAKALMQWFVMDADTPHWTIKSSRKSGLCRNQDVAGVA
jgi:hypothetical protein